MANNMFSKVFLEEMTIPATKTATVTSDPVSVVGYPGNGFYVFYGNALDVLSNSLSWDCKLQESDTENGTYTDVADADVEDIRATPDNTFGLADAPTDDSEIYGISYKGSKDWVKVIVTATGVPTYGTPMCILCAHEMPLSKNKEQKVDP